MLEHYGHPVWGYPMDCLSLVHEVEKLATTIQHEYGYLPKDLTEMKEKYIAKVREELETVYDPEISVDIYKLGLIYDVKITSEQYVFVLMSLTSAFCPAADSMPREIIQKIEGNMPGFKCKVKITMIPQWGREMIQPDIRELMGL